jgi:hypothetical protein
MASSPSREELWGRQHLLANRHRLFAVIVVEAALGLPYKPARLDIFHQQPPAPHRALACVEADEIGER